MTETHQSDVRDVYETYMAMLQRSYTTESPRSRGPRADLFILDEITFVEQSNGEKKHG